MHRSPSGDDRGQSAIFFAHKTLQLPRDGVVLCCLLQGFAIVQAVGRALETEALKITPTGREGAEAPLRLLGSWTGNSAEAVLCEFGGSTQRSRLVIAS